MAKKVKKKCLKSVQKERKDENKTHKTWKIQIDIKLIIIIRAAFLTVNMINKISLHLHEVI